ncbi:large ribosomal subunit protein bL19m-like [Ciona intestinalis]
MNDYSREQLIIFSFSDAWVFLNRYCCIIMSTRILTPAVRCLNYHGTETVNIISMRCRNVLKRFSSSFVQPKRPTLKSDGSKTSFVPGREDPKLFSSEYIPPLVRPEWHRNKLKYRLERMDCLRRRNVVNIPEFYPGSILAVTVYDPHAAGQKSRFVGRCLYRDGFGLGCKFLLRNIVEGEGIEIVYQLYSPVMLKYEVLRLEKWLDTDLRYLRDADPDYCTISFDMPAEAPLPPTEELPVFKGKVKMKKFELWNFNYHKAWPRPYNAYLEEYFVEEDFMEQKVMQEKRGHGHLQYDICKHYDTRQMKEEITKEMKLNQKRIEAVDKKIS